MYEGIRERFYDIVLAVARATKPAPDTAMLAARTNFARSAGSLVRTYIRNGGDLRALAAPRVTHASLLVAHTPRKATVKALEGRAARFALKLAEIAKELMAQDPEEARKALMPAFVILGAATGATQKPTRDASEAAEESRPLQAKGTFFVPIDLRAAREAQGALQ
ncbi:MAG: hypothetical protein KGL39_09620 [Patescibacteria group bacterium]|nr:hypothetical protein [Patescibacteria group bacterium]